MHRITATQNTRAYLLGWCQRGGAGMTVGEARQMTLQAVFRMSAGNHWATFVVACRLFRLPLVKGQGEHGRRILHTASPIFLRVWIFLFSRVAPSYSISPSCVSKYVPFMPFIYMCSGPFPPDLGIGGFPVAFIGACKLTTTTSDTKCSTNRSPHLACAFSVDALAHTSIPAHYKG